MQRAWAAPFLIFLSTASFAAEKPPTANPLQSFGGLPEKYPYLSPLGSLPSPYGEAIRALIQTWPKHVTLKRVSPAGPNDAPIESECYDTSKNPTYIGVGQRMVVAAPFDRVAEVVDRFADYPALFDGLVHINALAVDGNRTVTEWVEKIPFPFISNEHDQMIHLVSTPRPGFKIYRYGLKASNHLTQDDGAIVLERSGPNRTIYTEYDLFDADWGIVKSFGIDRIWQDCLEGIYQSDLALKLHAENPSWPMVQVLKESKLEARAMIKRKEGCAKAVFPVPSHSVTK